MVGYVPEETKGKTKNDWTREQKTSTFNLLHTDRHFDRPSETESSRNDPIWFVLRRVNNNLKKKKPKRIKNMKLSQDKIKKEVRNYETFSWCIMQEDDCIMIERHKECFGRVKTARFKQVLFVLFKALIFPVKQNTEQSHFSPSRHFSTCQLNTQFE